MDQNVKFIALDTGTELDPGKKGKSEIKRLRETHAQWDVYAPEWAFYLSAYEGGTGFANQDNLFRHVRENEDDFRDRAKRLDNLNYCEPIVDFYTNFIFTESIERDGEENAEFYDDFVKNVNLRGDSVSDFMRDVSDDVQIFGMSYILVDAPPPPADGSVVSKADEKALGIRPYWVLIKPEEITNWVVDDFGKFVYLKRKQLTTELDGNKVLAIEKYTEWFTDHVDVSRIDVSKPAKPVYLGKEILPNEMGKIPVVVARHKRAKSDTHIGLSFLRDFAYNNRKILNLSSLLDEFLYRQAFNILTMQIDPNGGGVPEQGADEQIIGTANKIDYPAGAERPMYISPPVDPAKFIQEERQRIQQEMFKRAAQDTLNELFNGEKSSGFSQAQSFSKTVPFISSRADVLEAVENELMALTMERISKEWKGKIKYKDRYEITNLTDALTQLKMLAVDLQVSSETFVKEELKRMVREFDGKLQPETLKKIMKEIDGMDFKEWKETTLSGGKTSAVDQQKPKSTGTMTEAAQEAKSTNTAATKKLKG
jgi:hypothetical protein